MSYTRIISTSEDEIATYDATKTFRMQLECQVEIGRAETLYKQARANGDDERRRELAKRILQLRVSIAHVNAHEVNLMAQGRWDVDYALACDGII